MNPIKFIGLGLCVFLVLGATGLAAIASAPARNPVSLYNCTREPVLLSALAALDAVGAEDKVNTLLEQGVHVLFRDMAYFGPMYKANDAITWVGDDGSQTIYISSRHMTAPPEALACLIAHEMLHNDSHNSTAEELVGWQTESTMWQRMVAQNPALGKIPVKKVPLVDRLSAIVVLDKQGKLSQTVQTNPVYQGLPAHSPGY